MRGDACCRIGGHGILLGVAPGMPRRGATVTVPPASTMLLYTAGLIERHGEDLDHGLARLRQCTAELAREHLHILR
ncbi:SpoIIE family protein phosphatase [Streptomyces sp900105755]|uniref:SpoIIE family protein phosphatase n=1 Tax=Streptomyces sp. 900105755 TaxID=3154389 RepID=UPI003329D134